MRTRTLSAALLLLAAPLLAGDAARAKPRAKKPLAAPPAAAAPAAAPKEAPGTWLPIDGLLQKDIKTGDIVVRTPVTGVTTAQDTYDVYAPFDGRIEDMEADLFDFVTPKTVLGRMVSTEMAALLDSSSEEERRQTESRWKDVYKYHSINPETQGVLTNIYVQPKTKVLRGDRLFTVARKVVVIAKNTAPLYSKLSKDLPADIWHARDPDSKYEATLTDFVPLKGSPYFYRMWLDVHDFKDGIKIGEQFDGSLFVGKSSDAMLVPRGDVLEYAGRRFLITEIKTGLETAGEMEITGHTSLYLGRPAAGDQKDGKTEKDR